MFVIQGGETAWIREENRGNNKKKKLGSWGRGRAWARLGCAGTWETGIAAPTPNLFCREEMWVSRACEAGEERAELRHQQKKHLGTPLKERKHGKGVLRTSLSTLGSFAASHELLPRHRPPWQGVAAQQLLLPFSHQQKWPHPSWHQCSRQAGARRRRATPERQDGLSLFSRVWAGSRLGRAGPSRPASLRACQGHGKGAARRRSGWRREKRLLLGRRGFSSQLPPPHSTLGSLPTCSSFLLGLPASSPQPLLALEP